MHMRTRSAPATPGTEDDGDRAEAGAGERARRRRTRPAVAPILRRHGVFLVVFVLGFCLRVVTQIAYRPAILYVDSFRYLENLNLKPTHGEPTGYPILLRVMTWVFGNLASIAALQHLLGLAMGAAIYAVLVRRGTPTWLAGLAAVPVLLDAYQLQIEQNILSETLFETIVLAAVVVLVWDRCPSRWSLAAGGVLFGAACAVRVVGLPMVVPAAAYAAWASPRGWARLGRAALVTAAFAVPVAAYAGYYTSATHRIGFTSADASLIAGRAQTIVHVGCRGLDIPSYERPLCPSEPRSERPGIDIYAHGHEQAQFQLVVPRGMTRDQVRRDFARRVFEHQPLDFVRAVLGDFAKNFALSPTTARNDVPVFRWQFQESYPLFYGPEADPPATIREFGGGGPATIDPLATFLRRYQLSVGFTPGPVLAAALAVALAAAAGLGRARRSPVRAACAFTAVVGGGLVLAANLFEFSWRYHLPLIVLAPMAGALGVTALVRGSAPAPPGAAA
jgi:hypothetical protein